MMLGDTHELPQQQQLAEQELLKGQPQQLALALLNRASFFQQGMAAPEPSRAVAEAIPTLTHAHSTASSMLELQHCMLAATAVGPSPQRPFAVTPRSQNTTAAGTKPSAYGNKALNLKRKPAAPLLYRAQQPKRRAAAGPSPVAAVAASSSSAAAAAAASHSPATQRLPISWPLLRRANTEPIQAPSQLPLSAQPKLQHVGSPTLPLTAYPAVSAQQQGVPFDVEVHNIPQQQQTQPLQRIPSGADDISKCLEATLRGIQDAHQEAQAALQAAAFIGMETTPALQPALAAAAAVGAPTLSAGGTELVSPTHSTVTGTPNGSQTDPWTSAGAAWPASPPPTGTQPAPNQLLAILRAATCGVHIEAAAGGADACRPHMTSALGARAAQEPSVQPLGARAAQEPSVQPAASLLLGRLSAAYSQLFACTQELVFMLAMCRQQMADSHLQVQGQQYGQQEQQSRGRGAGAEPTAAAAEAAAAAAHMWPVSTQPAPWRVTAAQVHNNSTAAGCVIPSAPEAAGPEGRAALTCLQQQLAAAQQQHGHHHHHHQQQQQQQAATTLASSAHEVLAVTECAEGLSTEDRMRLLNVVTELLVLLTQQKTSS